MFKIFPSKYTFAYIVNEMGTSAWLLVHLHISIYIYISYVYSYFLIFFCFLFFPLFFQEISFRYFPQYFSTSFSFQNICIHTFYDLFRINISERYKIIAAFFFSYRQLSKYILFKNFFVEKLTKKINRTI